MRKSGFLVLLVVTLLVSWPLAAEPYGVSNGSYELDLTETKIGIEEEVARLGENVTAIAVDTRAVGIATKTLITAHCASRGLHNYWRLVPVIRGGDALRGSP